MGHSLRHKGNSSADGAVHAALFGGCPIPSSVHFPMMCALFGGTNLSHCTPLPSPSTSTCRLPTERMPSWPPGIVCRKSFRANCGKSSRWPPRDAPPLHTLPPRLSIALACVHSDMQGYTHTNTLTRQPLLSLFSSLFMREFPSQFLCCWCSPIVVTPMLCTVRQKEVKTERVPRVSRGPKGNLHPMSGLLDPNKFHSYFAGVGGASFPPL